MTRAFITTILIILLLAGCAEKKPAVTGAAVTEQKGLILIGIGSEGTAPESLISLIINVSSAAVKDESGEWHAIPVEHTRIDIANPSNLKSVAQASLLQGVYTHVRVNLESALARTTQGQSLAIMPGNTLTFALPTPIEDGKTTVLGLMITKSESVRTTREGYTVFAPSVNAEIRTGTDATIDSSRNIITSRGKSIATASAGMDEFGDFGPERTIPFGSTLALIDGKIRMLTTDNPSWNLPKNVTVSVTLREGAVNPDRIEAFQEQTLTLNLRTIDVERGIAIKDLGIEETVLPGETRTIKIASHRRGAFDITCATGCGDKKGSVLGKLLIR